MSEENQNMNEFQSDRRLRSFILVPEILAAFVLPGKRVVKIHSTLPKTARFFSSFYDYERRAYVVVFEDESFELVQPGAAIPLGPSPIVQTIAVEDL